MAGTAGPVLERLPLPPAGKPPASAIVGHKRGHDANEKAQRKAERRAAKHAKKSAKKVCLLQPRAMCKPDIYTQGCLICHAMRCRCAKPW